MTEINPTYANLVSDFLDTGAALSSGGRWLMLTTDAAGTTESTDYDGRIDVTGAFGAASDGDRSNSSPIGPFTWLLGETVAGWAIMDDPTAGDYVLRGALDPAQVIGPLGTLTIGVGELATTVNAA